MNPRLVRLGCQTAAVFVLILLVLAILLAPKHPVASIRVVDTAGKPVAGVVIKPAARRTKSGPYRSGPYPWRRGPAWPVNDPVSTGGAGITGVSYLWRGDEPIGEGQ